MVGLETVHEVSPGGGLPVEYLLATVLLSDHPAEHVLGNDIDHQLAPLRVLVQQDHQETNRVRLDHLPVFLSLFHYSLRFVDRQFLHLAVFYELFLVHSQVVVLFHGEVQQSQNDGAPLGQVYF